MDRFSRELHEGQIHIRDKLQFELKSDFSPIFGRKTNVYKQEFYLFIPNALQANERTYPKDQFYRDQTNHIRYKTPEFRFKDLLTSPQSPLLRLRALLEAPQTPDTVNIIKDELKLFGNIVRSALRNKVRELAEMLSSPNVLSMEDHFKEVTIKLLSDLENVRNEFYVVEEEFLNSAFKRPAKRYFNHVKEFISITVDYNFTGLLNILRKQKLPQLQSIETLLCENITREGSYSQGVIAQDTEKDEISSEHFLYQRGLLNKFVLDALLLSASRTSSKQRYFNIIAAFAAGIAMLLFFLVFIWQGSIFVINSAPFIIVTVLAYIIKDRIKEGIKALYHHRAARWLSDYTTRIASLDGEKTIGKLNEMFSFVEEHDLPEDIVAVRNKEFHAVLETFKRPETVIYYKKEALIKGTAHKEARRYELNNIFRFNVHRFLEKASDAHHNYLTLDPQSHVLVKKLLPKVYHLNIIMRNTYMKRDGTPTVELQKFRLILDKEGIKRMEQVNPSNNVKV